MINRKPHTYMARVGRKYVVEAMQLSLTNLSSVQLWAKGKYWPTSKIGSTQGLTIETGQGKANAKFSDFIIKYMGSFQVLNESDFNERFVFIG